LNLANIRNPVKAGQNHLRERAGDRTSRKAKG
jgi:hypothetical protein